MDYLLPDDNTMEIMRREFARLADCRRVKPLAYSPPAQTRDSAYISGLLLFLYFVKILRYNMGYGTQIYDSDRSLGWLRCSECTFGKLNNLR